MPLYRVTTAVELDDAQRAEIAGALTDVHCDVTGAPDLFVHVFYFDGPETAIHGGIRAGRTDEQKSEIHTRMRDAFARIANVDAGTVTVTTSDIPASWVMEGGEVMPEPGDETDWLARHHN